MSTPNMTLVLPTDHGSADVWDTVLDAVFNLIDSHNHTTGKGVQVPSAGIGINADLSFAGFSLRHVLQISYDETVTPPSTVDSVWVKSTDHNLYFHNSAGVDVQITAGNTLNVAIVGGIGGDYSTVGALLSYDDATRRYLLQQEGSPRPWAGLATADIDLYQKAASITNKVTLKSPSALAASYTLTMPASMPGAFGIAQFDASNNMSVSSTLAAAPTAPDYKLNANLTLTLPISLADISSNTRITSAEQGMTALQLATNIFSTLPVPLRVGDQVTGFTLYVRKTSDGTNTIRTQLNSSTIGGGFQTFSTLGTTDLSTNNPGTIAIPITGLSHTIADAETMFISFGMHAGAATGDLVYGAEVTYKRP